MVRLKEGLLEDDHLDHLVKRVESLHDEEFDAAINLIHTLNFLPRDELSHDAV
jgi:hypothetical protein